MSKPKGYATLPPLVAVACATVLEDAIDKLRILGTIGNLPDINPDLTFQSPQEKYDKYVPALQVFDLDTLQSYDESLKNAKYIKFQTDRAFIEAILSETMTSLTKNRSYACLINRISEYNASVEIENLILETNAENRETYQGLETGLEKNRQTFLTEMQALSEEIGDLKDQIEDLNIENGIKLKYIKDWEESRLEQNDIDLDNSEAVYTNIINNAKNDIEKEMRINVEIESFISETQQDFSTQIQYWMDRYDNEVEFRDTELQMLKEKREEQFNRLQELSQLYEQERDEINQYLLVKERRRIAEEKRMRKERAATRIQAWWRGLMVRHYLGQFKALKGLKAAAAAAAAKGGKKPKK